MAKGSKKKTLKVFVVAGEASGDVLGGPILELLRRIVEYDHPKTKLIIQGVGGPCMQELGGFESIVPMETFAVMGPAIVWRLPRLIKAFGAVKQALLDFKPDVLLTIDAPELSFRLAKLAPKGVRRVHCVAPSVWAWRPGRAAKVAKFLDHLCVLFPFEPPYFTKHGLKATFVGHPKAEDYLPPAADFWNFLDAQDKNALDAKQEDPSADYDLEGNPAEPQAVALARRLLVLMPGSRRQEVKTLWPLFFQTAALLEPIVPDLTIAVLAAPGMARYLKNCPLHWLRLEGRERHEQALGAATCALVTSGTATLEVALAGCPMVVAYKVGPLLGVLLKRLIKTPFVALPNILSGKLVVPECLQSASEPKIMAPLLLDLLKQQEAYRLQRHYLLGLRERLQSLEGQPNPHTFGARVAQVVLTEAGFPPLI